MTAVDYADPLQLAIYTALNGNVDVDGVVPVYAPPLDSDQNENYPRITFGPSDFTDWSTKSEPGQDFSVQLDVWTTDGGRYECNRILSAIRGLLHESDFSLISGDLVQLQHVSGRVFTDPDGVTTHGLGIFRALISA